MSHKTIKIRLGNKEKITAAASAEVLLNINRNNLSVGEPPTSAWWSGLNSWTPAHCLFSYAPSSINIYIHTYRHKYIHRYKHTYWLGTIMDHEGHFIFTTAFRFVLFFQGSQGPGLPNQSTKLQNSNFPKYKRTLHHAAMWMRTKHVKQGALAYHR